MNSYGRVLGPKVKKLNEIPFFDYHSWEKSQNSDFVSGDNENKKHCILFFSCAVSVYFRQKSENNQKPSQFKGKQYHNGLQVQNKAFNTSEINKSVNTILLCRIMA